METSVSTFTESDDYGLEDDIELSDELCDWDTAVFYARQRTNDKTFEFNTQTKSLEYYLCRSKRYEEAIRLLENAVTTPLFNEAKACLLVYCWIQLERIDKAYKFLSVILSCIKETPHNPKASSELIGKSDTRMDSNILQQQPLCQEFFTIANNESLDNWQQTNLCYDKNCIITYPRLIYWWWVVSQHLCFTQDKFEKLSTKEMAPQSDDDEGRQRCKQLKLMFKSLIKEEDTSFLAHRNLDRDHHSTVSDVVLFLEAVLFSGCESLLKKQVTATIGFRQLVCTDTVFTNCKDVISKWILNSLEDSSAENNFLSNELIGLFHCRRKEPTLQCLSFFKILKLYPHTIISAGALLHHISHELKEDVPLNLSSIMSPLVSLDENQSDIMLSLLQALRYWVLALCPSFSKTVIDNDQHRLLVVQQHLITALSFWPSLVSVWTLLSKTYLQQNRISNAMNAFLCAKAFSSKKRPIISELENLFETVADQPSYKKES